MFDLWIEVHQKKAGLESTWKVYNAKCNRSRIGLRAIQFGTLRLPSKPAEMVGN